MKTSRPDGYLLVGACAPMTQEKLFKKLIRTTGYNEKHFVPVDIRGTDNKGILDRLRGAVEGILKSAETPPATACEGRIGPMGQDETPSCRIASQRSRADHSS